MISGMNHAVLYVRDARRQEAFYRDVLDFETIISDPGGRFIFMRAPGSGNHHDLAFFSVGADAQPSPAGRGAVGLYHLAWEVPTLADLDAHRRRLEEAGALVGASNHGVNKSLYARDPDGIEFEVMWLVPREEWGDAENQAIVEPLDLPGDVARFGPERWSSTHRSAAAPAEVAVDEVAGGTS